MAIKVIAALQTVLFVAIYPWVNGQLPNLEDVKKCTVITNDLQVQGVLQNRTLIDYCGADSQLQFVCCSSSKPVEARKPDVRISEKKCVDYSTDIFIKVPVLGNKEKTITLNGCGQRPNLFVSEMLYAPRKEGVYYVKDRSVSGREFPHAAAIGSGSGRDNITWFCTGALISEFYVLTAAHCLQHGEYGPAGFVRVGAKSLLTEDDKENSSPATYDVEQIIPYPSYEIGQFYDDIGLVKVSRQVEFNIFVRPACLTSIYSGPEHKALSVAFSDLAFGDVVITTILEYTIVDKLSEEECTKSQIKDENLSRGVDSKTQLCIGSRDELLEYDSCSNETHDGVLQVFHNSQYCMYSVTAVKAFGSWCSSMESPAVYTRVYPYLNWIEDIVWKDLKK